MSTSDKLAVASLLVSGVALLISLGVALYTVWRADKTASAGALIALQVAFRDAWDRFLNASGDDAEFHFADLLNLLETSCALYSNRSFTSAPRKLLKGYLENVFKHLAGNAQARERLNSLKQSRQTFEHIAKFETENRQSMSLKVTLFITD